ncbi:MAG: hypothetical protein KGZ85_08785 [Ignavibacterium sp.]|nr:hypothetical protein [Ignavibacterium sp.]
MEKIYIGPNNLANISERIEKSLTSKDIKADFITWSNTLHPFNYGKHKTFKLVNKPPFKIMGKNIFFFFNEYFLKAIYFLFALIKYDVFLFIKPVTFLKNNIDLKILKFFNKKVGIFNVGCHDRDVKFDTDPEYICNTCTDIVLQEYCFCNDIEKKVAEANFFAKYSNYVFGTPDNVSYIKDKSKVYNLVVGAPEIIIKASTKNFRSRIKISHLPSNSLVKGTHLIEPVLNRLANEEDLEIVIKKGIWSREKIIKEISESHILIDSLAGYIFGTICLEAIQYGCVPLNAYPKWISSNYSIPIVVKVTGDSLYSTLKELINNRELLEQHAARCQEAYNKYFTFESAGFYLKEILEL